MTFLPVVERELRVAARQRSAFWARLLSAGGAVLCAFGFLLASPVFGGASLRSGRELLATLAWLAFGLCVIAGPVLTSDTVSAEKREGTLGLLFLTDLRGIDVVLGKLVAASVTSVLALFAVLPVMAISILLGGVQAGDLLRTSLVLGNTLFLSLSIGILMSALCVQWRSALALTGFVLFVIVVVATMLAPGALASQPESLLSLIGLIVSPVCALVSAESTNYQAAPIRFWISLGSMHLLAWIALAAASWLTARLWREPTGWMGRLAERRIWYNWYYGGPPVRHKLRALVDTDPIGWLRWRQRFKRHLLWGAVGTALVFWIFLRIRYPYFAAGETAVFLVGLWLLGPIKWLTASEASHQLANELQSGALELLLTTPLSVREIVRGHVRSMDWLLMVPAGAVLFAQAVVIGLSATWDGVLFHSEDPMMGMTIVGMVTALWDIRTIELVGMWLALRKKRADRAFAGTVRRILFLPWFVLFALLMGAAFLYQRRPAPPLVWEHIPVVWFIICAGTNLYFGLSARYNLLERFRLLAAERYDAAR